MNDKNTILITKFTKPDQPHPHTSPEAEGSDRKHENNSKRQAQSDHHNSCGAN